MSVKMNMSGSVKMLLFMVVCCLLLIMVYLQTETFIGTSTTGAQSSKIVFLTLAKTERKTTFNDSASEGMLLGNLYQPGFDNPMPNLCLRYNKTVRLLIVITSAPSDEDARMAIRKTWGSFHRGLEVVVAFMVGVPDLTEGLRFLDEENSLHKDIIVNRNVDSYRNLTLKTAAILEWIQNFCPNAEYILKTDDDMFINVPRLLKFLNTLPKSGRYIYGRLAVGWRPVRDITSKYYLSKSDFNSTILPSFTTGPAYLMTSEVPAALYGPSLNLSFMPLEDVFFTGVVAQKEGILRVLETQFTNVELPPYVSLCSVNRNIAFHRVPVNQLEALWAGLTNNTQC